MNRAVLSLLFSVVRQAGFRGLTLSLVFACHGLSAGAATITQTVNFSTSASFSEALDTEIVPEGFFSGTFQPFDTALGALESWTDVWSIALGTSYTCSEACGASLDALGAFSYAGVANTLAGVGSSGGVPPGETLNLVAYLNHTNTFFRSDADVSFNQSILSTVEGSSAFPLKWEAPVDLSASGGAGTFNAAGTLTLTYEYTPVPEPSTFSLFALGLFGMGCLGRRRPKRS